MKRHWMFILGALAAVGCSEATQDSDGPVASQLAKAVDEPVCEEPYSGRLFADVNLLDDTGVGEYAYRADEEESSIELDLFDADGAELGRIAYAFDLDVATGTTTSSLTYERDGEVVARQSSTGRQAPGAFYIETLHELGERRAYLWTVIDPELGARQIHLGVPTDAAVGGDVIDSKFGRVRVLEAMNQGVQLDEASIEAWLNETEAMAFEDSEDYRRLVMSFRDASWVDALEAQLARCHVSATGDAWAEFGSLGGALKCDKGFDPYKSGITFACILGAADAGYQVTGAVLGVTAATLSGPAIAGTFVVATVAALVASSLIEKYVKANKHAFVGGALAFGNVLIEGKPEINQAAGEFFLSGGGKGGGSKGDPHLYSLDGAAFDVQAGGEFVLTRGPAASGFEVQARQEPLSGAICPSVTYNTAVAARVGSSTLEIRATSNFGADSPLWVDGEPVRSVGGFLALDGGIATVRDDELTVYWHTGEGMVARPRGVYVDIELYVPPAQFGRVEGLLGDADGRLDNDLAPRGRAPLGPVVSLPDFQTDFRDSWRVRDGESLFVYEADLGVGSFDTPGPDSPLTIALLPDDVREEAERACAEVQALVAFEDCVLDVGCSGDAGYVDSHLGRPDAERVAIAAFQDLAGWLDVGPSKGGWVASEDGQSIAMTSGGFRKLIVSPDDFDAFKLETVMSVGVTASGNYAGFAFGHQAPGPDAAGEDALTWETYLIMWGGGESAGEGKEGLTLSRLDGFIDGGVQGEVFFDLLETPEHTILATNYADDAPWSPQTSYAVTLDVTETGVTLFVDGEIALSYAFEASDASPSGAVGFWANGQSELMYSEVLIAPQ